MENKNTSQPVKDSPASPLNFNNEGVCPKTKKDKKRTVVEISTIDELNFETFLYSDLSKFDAKVVATEKKVFQPRSYAITIHISNLPTIKTSKYYNEFKAFYKALKLRYGNIQWPELPSQYSIFKKKAARVEAFNQVLQIICSIAKRKDNNKKNLLGIFYAFFFDKESIFAIKRQNSSNTSSPSILKKASSHDDDHDNENDHENEAENKRLEGLIENSILNLERQYNYLLHDKDDNASVVGTEDSKTECLMSIDERVESQASSSSPIHSNGIKESPTKSEKSPVQTIRKTSSDDLSKDLRLTKDFRSMSVPDYANSVEQQQRDGDEVYQRPSLNKHGKEDANRNTEENLDIIDDVEEEDEDQEDEVNAEDTAALEAILTEEVQQASKGNKLKYRFKKMKKNILANRQNQKGVKYLDDGPSGLSRHSSIGATVLPETNYTRKQVKNNSMIEDIDHELNQQEAQPRRRARAISSSAKEILNYSGLIYMRLSSEPKWNRYFARISEGCILLYRNMLDPSPIHYVPCFRCLLSYVQTEDEEYIEMWHSYDAERFQICLRPKDHNEKDSTENDKELSGWIEQIRILYGLNLENKKYSPIGKFQIVVYQALDIQGLPNKSSCYVRLSHPPFNLATSKCPKNASNNDMKWKQSFFLPICDIFFPISIEIVCSYNDGWITGKQKEEVICTGELLVADIISVSQNYTLKLKVPLKYTENKAKVVAKNSNVNEIPLSPVLEIRLKNLSSVKSLFAPPYGDYIEGVKINAETWSKQLMKLGLSRAKRIFAYLNLKSLELKSIFNFKYPLFSFVCFLLFTYVCIAFEMADLIPTLILLLVVLSVYKHPSIEPVVDKKLDFWFFETSHLNSHYQFPQVQTMTELETKKMMQTEKWKYKLVDPDSLVTVFRKAKNSLVSLTILLAKVTGFFEKIKNIITWQDPLRTKIFILVSLIGYCTLSVISFRLIALLSVWGQFMKGIKHFESLKKRNREAAHTALKVIIKEFYPEYQSQIFDHPGAEWSHISNFNTFQTKIVEKMKTRLGVFLPGEVLLIARSPLELVFMIGTCSQPLKANITPAEEVSLGLHKKKVPKFKPKNLIYFIMNIPSDYYRVIHPRSIVPEDYVES